MIAILCPGQGAQAPGMLTPWLELPSFSSRIEAYSEAAGLDLTHLGTVATAEEIRDTAITQPLLVAAALASAAEILGAENDTNPAAENLIFAGHSVGEFGAAALAGVVSDLEAMSLVAVRGKAMATAAAAAESTSMAAVLGGDESEVLAAIAANDLTAANMNGGGQIVAAGAKSGIDSLIENAPARARVIELQVAGAFHTSYMEPAIIELEAAAAAITPKSPNGILLSNQDGQSVTAASEVISRLISQVASPVRWDLCQQQLLDLGVTGLIELAPGGVLTGLAKRNLKGIPAVAVKTPEDIVAAKELLEA